MIDSNRIQQRDRPVPRDEPTQARPKQQPSPFDQVLQQRVIQQPPAIQQQVGRDASREQSQAEEKNRRQDQKDKPRARQRDESTSKSEDRSQSEVQDHGPKHRIVVKTTRDGEGGKQGRGGGEGGGHSGFGGRGGGAGARTKTESKSSHELADLKAAVGRAGLTKFQHELVHKAQTPTIDRQQMQRLVNLLVQSIRVGKNAVGADELSLVFQAAVFQGLRLRLQSKNGRVSIHFSGQSKDVRKLFLQERGRIREALERKGIRVDTIEVE